MNWDTIGYSRDHRISIVETKDGYEMIRSEDWGSQSIEFTREEASNIVRFLRQAEQAHIDTYRVRVYEDGIDSRGVARD